MHFFKQLLVTIFITFSMLLSVGCESGEADYALEDVQSQRFVEDLINGTITFITANTMVVQESQNDITVLKADSNLDLTYSIVGGADQLLFIIDERTGQLSFIVPPLYVVGLSNTYEVIVGVTTATDGLSTLPMTVTVVQDIKTVEPLIDFSATNIEAVSSTDTITQIKARPADESSSLTYTLVGADADAFQIDENGNLFFEQPLPDFGTTPNKQYDVSVVITDGYGNSITTEPIVITLVGNPDLIRPVVETETIAIVENALGSVQIVVSTLGTGEINRYILGGADAAYFNVTSTGQLSFKEAKDFETLPTVFSITIQVGDDKGNLSDVKTIVVSVKDIDEQFTFQNFGDYTPMEGDKSVGQITATPNTLSSVTTYYTLVQGGELLEVDAFGNIQFQSLAQKGQTISVQIGVESQLNGSKTLSRLFTVTVVDDPSKIPPEINQNYSTLNTVTAPIDVQTAVTTVQASPAGDSTALTYSTGGADSDKFTVDENGNLYFLDTYDYYAKSDANGDNVYEVIVIVEDNNGNSISTQPITVALAEDPNKIAPVITSSTFSFNENAEENIVIQVSAQGNGIVNSYTIVGGFDSGLFTFVDGDLSFKAPRDFETPSSVAGSNSYRVILAVGDDLGNSSEEKEIIVNIQNIVETLEFTSLASFTHTEYTSMVGLISATPKLSMTATMTYAIASGSTYFVIDEDSGILSFKTAPVYDVNGNNIYTLTVNASSQYNGSRTTSDTITVTVMPASFAITFDSDQSSISMDQNTDVSFLMTATSEAGETLTYSLEEGYNPTIFSINASTGELTINAPAYLFSNETDANIYRAAVVAKDNKGHSARRQGTLTVNEEDGIPSFTSPAIRSVSENVKVLSTVIATSPIGSPLNYSIDGGADSGLFNLTASGELSFAYAQNFEDPQDLNRDNVYEVNIRVTDTLYSINSVVQTIYVTVLNVNDAPSNIIFSSTGTTSVSVDDKSLISLFRKVTYKSLTATPSPSAGALTYRIVSNPDSSTFSMSSSGELKVEAGTYNDDTIFTLIVEVSEIRGEISQQTIYVTILD